MAEQVTVYLWRARSVIGKKGLYTTRHRMDEEQAAEYFAKEGITEYSRVEASAKLMVRLADGEYETLLSGYPKNRL